MSDEKPNIVMVVMDTCRAQSMACYGGEARTPFLSSLAEEGVKYERAVSQAVWTLPSHASMFTGKYQTGHHVMRAHKDDFNDLDMVQEKIAEEGYDRIGVVNVAFLWPKYGFDQYFDRYDYVNSNFLTEKGITDEIEDGDSKFAKLRKAVRKSYRKDGFSGVFGLVKFLAGEVTLLNDTGARETNRLALEHLDDQEEPFFLFLNYLEPHEPLSPPFPYSHKYLDNKLKWLSLTSLGIFSKYVRRLTTRFYDSENEVDEEELGTLESLYKGEIEYLDGKLEELFSEIREEHPDTVFIVTSDHGEAFGEHDHFQHYASLWGEVTRVPLIESYPDGRSENIEYPVETRQLHDHILDIARGEVEVIPDGGEAICQVPEKNVEDYDYIDEENMIHDFSKNSVSVESGKEKVIRGHEDADIRIDSDFREEEVDEVSDDGLEEKARSMIDKLKIFS